MARSGHTPSCQQIPSTLSTGAATSTRAGMRTHCHQLHNRSQAHLAATNNYCCWSSTHAHMNEPLRPLPCPRLLHEKECVTAHVQMGIARCSMSSATTLTRMALSTCLYNSSLALVLFMFTTGRAPLMEGKNQVQGSHAFCRPHGMLARHQSQPKLPDRKCHLIRAAEERHKDDEKLPQSTVTHDDLLHLIYIWGRCMISCRESLVWALLLLPVGLDMMRSETLGAS